MLLAEEFVGDRHFFLGWGDIIVPPANYRRMIEMFAQERSEAALAINWLADPYEGAAVYIRDHYVVRIEEKPPRGTATTCFNNAGLFIFGPELMGILRDTPPSPRGEIEVPSAIQTMLKEGRRIRAYLIRGGYWSDVARPSAAVAISGKIVRGASHHGILLHPTAQVAAGAMLVPPVCIGADARVGVARLGPNAVVMDGAVIEDGAVVQEGMVFAHSEVGANATIRFGIVEEGVSLPRDKMVVGTRNEVAVARGD